MPRSPLAILFRLTCALALPAVYASSPASAAAQVGERGRITTRSDVKMSIEGVPGTSGQKLQALAKTLSTPLAAAKSCYGELVKEHPEVVGTLQVELELPATGKLLVRAPNATHELKPMKACVDKAFGALDVSAVPRPAGARLLLELTNSAASSVQEVRKQQETEAQVEVSQGADGSFSSHGKSTEGEVSYDVKAADQAAVEKLHNIVRAALPGLFDCRRRASKLASPEGDLTFKLDPKGAIVSTSSTVKNERAPTCVGSVLKRAPGRPKAAASLTIHFAPLAGGIEP
ncbi:MAG: hypothetical protein JWN48_6097 [Myxococcaceae bacterium]|nr:hypothetical protein [Myxococcaceae bacterium]